MNIHDDKKRERIYTHHKTVLNKKEFIKKLPGWDINKFDMVLNSLKQKEIIEVNGVDIKIFMLPAFEKEILEVNDNKANHNSHLTDNESELLTLLSLQSKSC
jgi:hypothetical protein